MQPKPSAIGVFTWAMGGYYYGAMLSGIYQVTRAAGVPLLIIQSGLKDIRLPTFGAEYVAGWIVLHPREGDQTNLAALLASGVPVLTVATALDDVACTSVVADNRGDTRALVNHLIDHGHRHIAYLDHGPDTWSRERYQGYLDALQARGIALDPSLVIDTAHIRYEIGADLVLLWCGQHAARELIARGMPCTALVAGTDLSAIAAMRVFQEAGYRIPDDVAVVGFDDVADAQYAQPPLTTARTRFDQLGQIAAEELLALLRGEHDAQPRRIYAPPSLLRRRSCGCAGVEVILVQGADALAAASGWQAALARQLVAIVSYPLTPAPGTPPEQIWPGAITLVAAVEAALQGQDSDTLARELEVAWQQAVVITENQELLNTAVALLEDVAERRLVAAAAGARSRSIALFRQIRTAMMQARLAEESRKNESLTHSSITNRDISDILLSSQVGESQSLTWLRRTPAIWGCLALWETAPSNTPARLAVAGVYQRDGAASVAIGARYGAAGFPTFELLPASARQGHDLIILDPLRAEADELGVLALCGYADQNSSLFKGLYEHVAGLLSATLRRDALITRLEDQAQELAQARDAAEAANRAKSAFLAQMSHELRTPLNGILGYAQILTRKRLDDKTINGLTIIHQSGQHLLKLINDILDLAKIEAGRLELAPTPLHLPSFLHGIVDIIRARAETKQLSVAFEAPPSLPEWVLVDETRLREILLNLLGNAVKFTDRGQVSLRVLRTESEGLRTETTDSDPILTPHSSALLRFEVTDTGVGIAAEQIERIFQPFEQASTIDRRAEGSGLGLAISRQLVRLMGGDLLVKSEMRQGSTFWFELILPVIDTVGTTQAPDQIIGGYTGPQQTVLIVDDIAANRSMLVDILAPLGFAILEASNGQAGLALAQERHPNLIVLDTQMPVMDGLEATHRLRQIPDLQATPIVAVSASASEADQAKSLAVGANSFVPKPIDLDVLLPEIGRLLQLTWLYEPADGRKARPGVEVTPMEPPPPQELEILSELALLGKMRQLRERAAALEQLDAKYRPFATHVQRLARGFDIKQIQALLKQYLEAKV